MTVTCMSHVTHGGRHAEVMRESQDPVPSRPSNYLQVVSYLTVVCGEEVPSSVVLTVEAPTHARSHR